MRSSITDRDIGYKANQAQFSAVTQEAIPGGSRLLVGSVRNGAECHWTRVRLSHRMLTETHTDAAASSSRNACRIRPRQLTLGSTSQHDDGKCHLGCMQKRGTAPASSAAAGRPPRSYSYDLPRAGHSQRSLTVQHLVPRFFVSVLFWRPGPHFLYSFSLYMYIRGVENTYILIARHALLNKLKLALLFVFPSFLL